MRGCYDEGKGEAVTDSSDNGLDGKIAKGKPKWVKGKFDGAMEFGGQDMVTVDDDNALDLAELHNRRMGECPESLRCVANYCL